MSDLLGRTGSYAQLYYVGDTTDPQRGEVLRRCQPEADRHLHAAGLLRARAEPHRRCGAGEAPCEVPALAHYKPWLDNLRKEKPYQLDDELESCSSRSRRPGSPAWNRLFDETMAELRFDVDGEEPLTLEPTLNLLSNADRAQAQGGAEALAGRSRQNSGSSR